MTSRASEDRRVRRLGPTAVAVLESIYQHRLLSTRQAHALHTPGAWLRSMQRILAEIQDAGLVASVHLPGRLALWHLTERGVEAVEAIPNRAEPRRKLIDHQHAAGPLQQHTIAVNDVGIAFVGAARERGDECGPLAWRHEIAHPLGPLPGRRRAEQLIADAVLTYQLNEPDETSFHYRFVELDRANRATNDLSSRLARYARLYRHKPNADRPTATPAPGWTYLYPIFPEVLVVLAGETSDRLARRRRTVLALCQQEQWLAACPQVRISVCLLDELVAAGPFAPIFRSHDEPDAAIDWLGQPARMEPAP